MVAGAVPPDAAYAPRYSSIPFSTDAELDDFLKSGFDEEIIEYRTADDADDFFARQQSSQVGPRQPTAAAGGSSRHLPVAPGLYQQTTYHPAAQAYQHATSSGSGTPTRTLSPRARVQQNQQHPQEVFTAGAYLPNPQLSSHLPPLPPPMTNWPSDHGPSGGTNRRLVRRTQIVEEFEEVPSQSNLRPIPVTPSHQRATHVQHVTSAHSSPRSPRSSVQTRHS